MYACGFVCYDPRRLSRCYRHSQVWIFLIFLNCFYLLTILGEIYYSRWSVKIASLSLLVYLSHIFLATCKKQNICLPMLKEELGSGFSAISWLIGPVFVFGAIAIKIYIHFKIFVIPNLNFKFHSFSIYPCKVGVSPFYVNGEMCKW